MIPRSDNWKKDYRNLDKSQSNYFFITEIFINRERDLDIE
jgi:hypothetical protein